MGVEGVVAVAAGVAAGSVALVAFGLDSAIEGLASLAIVWRFTGDRIRSETAERRAQFVVGGSFLLLAAYIAVEAVVSLAGREEPSASTVGIALAAASLVVMPGLGIWKRRLGRRLGSPATVHEADQNVLCALMAAALLVGLLGNALLGWWWLDPVAALVIAGLAVQEGVESLRGED